MNSASWVPRDKALKGISKISKPDPITSGMAGRDGGVGGDSLVIRGSRVSLRPEITGGASGPTGVRSAARGDSAPGKGGKVSRVASALPHSEGGASKRGGLVKWHRACETGGWGRSTLRGTETTELGPEPIRLWRTGVSGASRGDGPSGLPFGARHRSTVDRVVGGCAKDHGKPARAGGHAGSRLNLPPVGAGRV
jgi:hypothetical protein